MRRKHVEALMSIGAVVIVVLTLMAFDARVRGEMSLFFSTPPATHVANVSSRLRGLTSSVTQTANSLSAEQTTLLFFVLASGVVFVFMLRT
jgi:hypothetical protein